MRWTRYLLFRLETLIGVRSGTVPPSSLKRAHALKHGPVSVFLIHGKIGSVRFSPYLVVRFIGPVRSGTRFGGLRNDGVLVRTRTSYSNGPVVKCCIVFDFLCSTSLNRCGGRTVRGFIWVEPGWSVYLFASLRRRLTTL